MTDNTALYGQVVERVRQLSTHLIPNQFDDFSEYDPCFYDMARGYCLLVHAEFESYFETIGFAYVNSKCERWLRGEGGEDCVIAILVALAIENKSCDDGIFAQLLCKMKKRSSKGKISKYIMEFSKVEYKWLLGRNNGIKKEDLTKILSPTGVFEQLEDYIDFFDKFGQDRGGIAHSNVGEGLLQQIDPKVEYNRVADVMLPNLAIIDSILLRNNPDLIGYDWSSVSIRDTS